MASEEGVHVQLFSTDERLVEGLRDLLSDEGARLEVFDSPVPLIAAPGGDRPACVIFDVGTIGAPNAAPKAACVEAPVILVDGTRGLWDDGDAPGAEPAGAIDGAGSWTSLKEMVSTTLARVRRVARARAEGDEACRCLAEITPREREVLDRVVEGWSARRIAEDLGISSRTVEVHRSHVMQKLHAHSIPQLVRIVTECRMYYGPEETPAPQTRRVRGGDRMRRAQTR